MEPPYEIIDNCRIFDWRKTITYINLKGIEKFGNQFQLQKEDWPIIKKLILYHVGDEERCFDAGLNLQKGILLTGPIGCGKTSMMQLFQELSWQEQRFQVIPTRKLAFNFQEQGYSVINEYGKKPKTICFDDLGLEQNIKFYGNDCNVMGEILLHRYDLFKEQNIRTHLTTNLNSTELEKHYGNRLRSRLREMFNLVSFPESCNDKRK